MNVSGFFSYLIVIMLMCDNIPHCKALLNFSTNIDEQKEMEVSCYVISQIKVKTLIFNSFQFYQ